MDDKDLESVTYRHQTAMHCPYCGHRHTAASDFKEGSKPVDGNLSLCIECARFAMFTMGGTAVRELTEEEEQEVQLDAEAMAMRNRILVGRELFKGKWAQ